MEQVVLEYCALAAGARAGARPWAAPNGTHFDIRLIFLRPD